MLESRDGARLERSEIDPEVVQPELVAKLTLLSSLHPRRERRRIGRRGTPGRNLGCLDRRLHGSAPTPVMLQCEDCVGTLASLVMRPYTAFLSSSDLFPTSFRKNGKA